ncbi:MAG: lipopolysaccharide core heptose(II) kinase RfaY, partial [Fusobacteriaceae bacterium]
MLKNEKYEEYQIYYSEKDREIKEIARLILDNNYKVLEKYKDTERNFVAKIEVKGKIFVLKSPKAETVIPQRKFQTLWKKGEALNSLYNLDKYRDDGLNYFIVPRAVMVKRVFFIEASYILMDYEEGDILSTSEDIDEVMEIVKKIHEKGIYHGDLNTSNFIKTKSGIKAIDTQGKQESFTCFKRNYDILTLKRDLLVMEKKYDVEENYPIKKFSLGYILA